MLRCVCRRLVELMYRDVPDGTAWRFLPSRTRRCSSCFLNIFRTQLAQRSLKTIGINIFGQFVDRWQLFANPES